MSPRISGTSHFAWSLDRRHAYFHQSHLEPGVEGGPVRATDLTLFELDVQTGREHSWRLAPPPEDNEPESAIWVVEIDHAKTDLQARLLPRVRELDGLALSHLDIDSSGGDGFVLFANFKEADVAEETHGPNVYGEAPSQVAEHYSGMIVEALNYGLVIRYEWRNGVARITTFSQAYEPSRTSLGHTWLPINIQLDASRRRLFCSFSGFRPRLLPRHIADAYSNRIVDPDAIRYVPPVIMRLDAQTLRPDVSGRRSHISYAEPMAMTLAGSDDQEYVCTFSPEVGLRIYDADDLGTLLCHAESPQLMNWRDSHFRPDPAHMVFVPR
jgi:hypothetical protein